MENTRDAVRRLSDPVVSYHAWMRELGYFLNIDKPPGMTSRDVVNRVGRILGTKRVGHAGTLDPMATGVLVVAVERATRLVEYVQSQRKTYLAEFQLGQTSETDDIEGTVEQGDISVVPQRSQVEATLTTFLGRIEQKPPAYSALKISGKRAYKRARQGEVVDLPPRPVEVHSIELMEYTYPLVRLCIECGSGTYIRSIARDLGAKLGVGGLMSRLRRTSIGVFDDSSAIPIDLLTPGFSNRRSLSEAVVELPNVLLDPVSTHRFQLGQRSTVVGTPDATEVAVFASAGVLLGIGQLTGGVLKPVKGGFSDSGH